MVTVTAPATVPVPKRSVRSAWLSLVGTIVGFPLSVLAGFGIYAAFDLCMESEESLCEAGTWPAWWQLSLITTIAIVLIVGPCVVALRLAIKALRTGNRAAWPVIALAAVLILLLTPVLVIQIW